VRDLFDFEGPQTLTVKGKGEIAAYRLIGYKAQDSTTLPGRARAFPNGHTFRPTSHLLNPTLTSLLILEV
jgi:hypothetical protein